MTRPQRPTTRPRAPRRVGFASLAALLLCAAPGCKQSDARECGAPSPCGDPRDDELTGDTYTCLMEALRDGGPGKVTIRDSRVADSSTDVTVVFGDGEAIIQTSGYSNGEGEYVGEPSQCGLESPAYFQACLDSPTQSCASPWNWVVDCAPVDEFPCP
ncbi:MAG: hypothetical protein R3A79_27530 [Nannocystaceae bacterium]